MNSNNISIDYALKTSEVLLNYGGVINNNLQEDLSQDDDNSLFFYDKNSSLYYDLDGLESFLLEHKKEFCLLNLNIQCLHSKFDEFRIILYNLKQKSHYFDCIMLQETWMSSESNYDIYNIEGYKIIKKDLDEKCSKHTVDF